MVYTKNNFNLFSSNTRYIVKRPVYGMQIKVHGKTTRQKHACGAKELLLNLLKDKYIEHKKE